ncbi:DUF2185 domain-containing protein [Ohtaekwangia kribbensis]|jgi:hypothetical protein|uniref:DUF2185 domain-containing protein n=1 Tax=Ohtaekwangia kribbensis TaxID=688913 RepID=A0ABW3K7L5_9BACT
MEKKYKITGDKIRQLINPMGGCMATDKITVEGKLIDFMYRMEPDFEHDSGWRFLSGTEDQEYVDNADNWAIYDVNTIANYDPAIIDYLNSPIGTELERIRENGKFRVISSE